MPEVSYAGKADPNSVYADGDPEPLIEATQSEQASRYAEILRLEQKLIGPLRPHKEDRLRRVLANTEAVYEAQWIQLEMAVGSCTALTVRRRVEAQQERQWGLPLPVCGLGLPTRSSRKRNQGRVCCCHPADDLHVVRISESSG